MPSKFCTLALMLAFTLVAHAADSITATTGTTTYQEQATRAAYLWDGRVTISTSGSLDNYRFGATFASGQQPDDVLAVRESVTDAEGVVDSVLVVDNAIYWVVDIGTSTSPNVISMAVGEQVPGTATQPLVVRFNRNATTRIVAEVVNRFAFNTPSTNPTATVRTVTPWLQSASDPSPVPGSGVISVFCSLINDPPTASPQTYPTVGLTDTYVYRDTTFTGTLAIQDPDSTAMAIALTKGPAHGSVVFSSTLPVGFTYQPAAGYTGGDTFTYMASDGALSTAATTVNLTIQEPPAGTFTFGTVMGVSVDTTIPAPTIGTAWTIASGATLGNVSLVGQHLIYIPSAPGTDQMVLTATDGVSTRTQPLTVITTPTADVEGVARPQFVSLPGTEECALGSLWAYDASVGNAPAVSFQTTVVDPLGAQLTPSITSLSSTSQRIGFTPTMAGPYLITIITLNASNLASDAQQIIVIARPAAALRPGAKG